MLGTSRLALRLQSYLCQFLFLLAFPLTSQSHSLSKQECAEGADYIQRAAHFRDHGVSEARFIGIFDKDAQESQATPPEQRWFMQDEEDRGFLRAAVVGVFQRPQGAGQHAEDFYLACDVRSDATKTDTGIRS